MATIQENLTTLQTTKAALKASLSNYIDNPGDTFSEYPNRVLETSIEGPDFASLGYGPKDKGIVDSLNSSIKLANSSQDLFLTNYNTKPLTTFGTRFNVIYRNLEVLPQVDFSKIVGTLNYANTVLIGNPSLMANLIYAPVINLHTNLLARLFLNCSKLIKIGGIEIEEYKGERFFAAAGFFGGCNSLEAIPEGIRNAKVVGNTNTGYPWMMAYAFTDCFKITSIPFLDCTSVPVAATTNYRTSENNLMFRSCSKLETVEGFKNCKFKINLQWSPNLSVQSVSNILENAADLTGTTVNANSGKLVLNTALQDKVTQEQQDLATSKNWTISFA